MIYIINLGISGLKGAIAGQKLRDDFVKKHFDVTDMMKFKCRDWK